MRDEIRQEMNVLEGMAVRSTCGNLTELLPKFFITIGKTTYGNLLKTSFIMHAKVLAVSRKEYKCMFFGRIYCSQYGIPFL
jgi:hypothetical protein